MAKVAGYCSASLKPERPNQFKLNLCWGGVLFISINDWKNKDLIFDTQKG